LPKDRESAKPLGGPIPCGRVEIKNHTFANFVPPSPRMKQDFPAPPPHLRPETASWWRLVCEEFSLEPHHLRILRLACEAWDAGQAARESLACHGQTYVDRFGQPRARPEIAIERDSRIGFARLLRELALDVSAPDGGDCRPPALPGRSNVRGVGR